MISKQELKASLETIEGWSRLKKKFLFFFGGPEKTFKLFSEAIEKDVLTCNVIAQYRHEDNNYYITAFSTKGDIPVQKLAELQEKAEQLDLGTVRYESNGPGGFYAWREDCDVDDDYTIYKLGDSANGLYVVAVAGISEELELPYVIYALSENKRRFYWVKKELIS